MEPYIVPTEVGSVQKESKLAFKKYVEEKYNIKLSKNDSIKLGNRTIKFSPLQDVSREPDNKRIQGSLIHESLSNEIDLAGYYPVLLEDEVETYMIVIWRWDSESSKAALNAINPSFKVQYQTILRAFSTGGALPHAAFKYKSIVLSLDLLMNYYRKHDYSSLTDELLVIPVEVENDNLSDADERNRNTKRKPKITKKTFEEYLEDYMKNNKTGTLGEILALNFERKRLELEGAPQEIIDQIIHVSVKVGDGLGYDIESRTFNLENNKYEKRYIEVKSTYNKSDFNFFVTKNENKISEELKANYYVYRVYNVEDETPFIKVYKGSFEENFVMETATLRVLGNK